MGKHYSISFVIPFFNESKYLKQMLESLEEQNLDDIFVEIILVDGKSIDNSKDIILDFISVSKNENIDYRIFDNNYQKTPFGFNIGIENSEADIVGFGGAHAIYPQNLFLNVLDVFSQTDADVIGGGHKKIIPDKLGILSKAVSALYVSPLGAGVASYLRKTDSGYVDTVWGGFYKKFIFENVGNFNTRLSRSQDYELNTRVRDAGYKIYFNPIFNNDYIIKTDLNLLFKRAFRTGYFLPEAWYENISSLSLRHIVPAIFLIYVLGLLIIAFCELDNIIIYTPIILYGILIFYSSLWLSIIKHYGLSGMITIPIFFLYHLSYGLGTLFGLIYHAIKRK